MANLIKGTKIITTGSEGFVVPDSTYGFQRQANISSDWKKIRIGVIISPTSNSALNAQPPNEEIAPTGNLNTHLLFGVSNGVGAPGSTGNRFIGTEFKTGPWGSNTAIKTYSSGAQWAINSGGGFGIQYLPLNGIFTDGTASALTSGKDDFGGVSSNATGTSNFGLFLSMELDITTAGVLVISGSVIASIADTSDALLIQSMQGAYNSMGTQSGGWWSSGVPIGCRYFYFRTPFLNSRMRIHNSAIIQLL